MSDAPSPAPDNSGHEVRTHFVRNRNVLIARADFSELYVDYYLHAGDHKIHLEPAFDAMFKRALAAFTLHCASRPWQEMTAWTMNFQEPLVNIFLTGDNETGAVTGRVFTQDVKKAEKNVFYADIIRTGQSKRRSAINFDGADPFVAVEAFYVQSEQRAGKFFQLGDDEFALVSEHPDCDKAWFETLTVETVRDLEKVETLNLMEKRIERWHCGCNQQRMMSVLAPVMRQDSTGLFGAEEKLEMLCPRCAARHVITREAMEAFMAKNS